ncbi:matrilysin-like [Leptinotarsa decemlineata]|uniref:matrilysin-like n=1 Tax=Leptinotarsa decemlineata TaxID=7539 RepID=UPI003D30620C
MKNDLGIQYCFKMLWWALIFFPYLTTCENVTNKEEMLQYLFRYGYVENNNSLTDFESTMIGFQEKYNLPIDGTLNSDTLSLIQRPRCVIAENAFTIQGKWNKTYIKWSFPRASAKMLFDAEKAFSLWEDISNLKFKYVRLTNTEKPDITISVVKRRHSFRRDCMGNGMCQSEFDGPGRILAHAYPPSNDACSEIHLDKDESWDVDGNGGTNFLMTLTHEIGHVLGLGHSSQETSIMFPWYQQKTIQLGRDDEYAITSLYGQRNTTAVKTTQRSTSSKKTSTTNTPQITKKNISDKHSPNNEENIQHP